MRESWRDFPSTFAEVEQALADLGLAPEAG
jgi:hypothetical protein